MARAKKLERCRYPCSRSTTERNAQGLPEDIHSRYIEAEVFGILIGCLNLPNGNPAPGPKWEYKLEWFKRFDKYTRELFPAVTRSYLRGF